MIDHYLKTLGLALVAALAMGAVLAGGASASEPAELNAEVGSVTIDGTQPAEQVQVFTREGEQVFCESATFHAEAEDEDEAIALKPSYEGCTMLGVGPATIEVNGCSYLFNLTDNTSSFTATSGLACPEGKEIEILAYVSEAKHGSETTVCEYTLGSQTGLKTTELTNENASEATPKGWIFAHLEIGEISSKSQKNFLICGEESDSSGTLEGELELKGTNAEEEPASIEVAEPEQTIHPPEGEVPLTLEAGEGTVDADQVGTWRFVRSGRTVECEEGGFVAHVENEDKAITSTEPSLAGCTGPLGLLTIVDMNGCDFHLALNAEEKEGGGDTFTAEKGIFCPAEASITFTTLDAEEGVVCELTFPEQEGLTTIDLTNEAANEEIPKDWIKAHLSVAGITATRTMGSAFICGPVHDESGALEGVWALKGTNSADEPTGLTVSTNQ